MLQPTPSTSLPLPLPPSPHSTTLSLALHFPNPLPPPCSCAGMQISMYVNRMLLAAHLLSLLPRLRLWRRLICIQELYIHMLNGPRSPLHPSPGNLILFARIKSLPQKFVRRPRVGFLKTLYKFYAFTPICWAPPYTTRALLLMLCCIYLSFISGCHACGFLLFAVAAARRLTDSQTSKSA